MPEATERTVHPNSKIVRCAFCAELLRHRNLHRHFVEECEQKPPMTSDQRICTSCQQVRHTSEFSRRSGRSTNLQCRHCAADRSHKWHAAHPKNNRATLALMRPGRWVLRPCEWCGERFNWTEMKKHRRHCLKRPVKVFGRPPGQPGEPPLAGMERIREQAMDEKGRKHKAYQLRWSYGLKVEQFEQLGESQGWLCAICRTRPVSDNAQTRGLHVDHNHATGAIRGLLCNRCNHGIGNFREDAALLLRAINYLRLHKHAHTVARAAT